MPTVFTMYFVFIWQHQNLSCECSVELRVVIRPISCTGHSFSLLHLASGRPLYWSLTLLVPPYHPSLQMWTCLVSVLRFPLFFGYIHPMDDLKQSFGFKHHLHLEHSEIDVFNLDFP